MDLEKYLYHFLKIRNISEHIEKCYVYAETQ